MIVAGGALPAAGFWPRVLASLVDGMLFGVLLALVLVLWGALLGSFGARSGTLGPLLEVLLALGGVGHWLYCAAMESSERRATLGKLVVGLRVVGVRGERLSFGRASARYFAKLLSGAPLGLGFLLLSRHGRKQAWHDRLADALVVKVG